MIITKKVRELVESKGYKVGNVDITIICQRPKLLGYIPEMVKNVSEVLGVSQDAINIKATTTEKLGFEGRQEGISAMAVVLLKEKVGDEV